MDKISLAFKEINLNDKLKKLGCKLPVVSTFSRHYEFFKIRENVVCVTIQFPILNKEYKYQGRLSDKISTEEGSNYVH